jgi:hypothetical protein
MKMPHMVAIVATFVFGVFCVLNGWILASESDRFRIIPWLIITYCTGIIAGGTIMFVVSEDDKDSSTTS